MPTEPNISGEIIERVFAAGLGLPHRRVATWRKEHLEKGADWRYEKEAVSYTHLTLPTNREV